MSDETQEAAVAGERSPSVANNRQSEAYKPMSNTKYDRSFTTAEAADLIELVGEMHDAIRQGRGNGEGDASIAFGLIARFGARFAWFEELARSGWCQREAGDVDPSDDRRCANSVHGCENEATEGNLVVGLTDRLRYCSPRCAEERRAADRLDSVE